MEEDQPPPERGFRRIGNLMPMIGPSPSGSGSTPDKPATNSATTGSASPAPVAASSTGLRLSETAAETLRSVVTGAVDEKAAKNSLAAMLARLLGISPAEAMREETRGFYSEDGQYDYELTAVRLPPMDRATALAAWDLVGPLCEPAKRDRRHAAQVAEKFARMMSVMAGGKRDAAETELATDTMIDVLCDYPVDCVLRALEARMKGRVWRPSLAEILADVQWRARHRECLKAAFVKTGVVA